MGCPVVSSTSRYSSRLSPHPYAQQLLLSAMGQAVMGQEEKAVLGKKKKMRKKKVGEGRCKERKSIREGTKREEKE